MCKLFSSTRSIFKLIVLCLVSITSGACNSWDEEVAAPENFAETYTQLHPCKASAHPQADYVITWLSPEGEATWDEYLANNADVDFPIGTVSVKAQYTDASCADLEAYTIMEKTSTDSSGEEGGWLWQHVGSDGECLNCDNGVGCASCHAGCQTGPAYFCTVPEMSANE